MAVLPNPAGFEPRIPPVYLISLIRVQLWYRVPSVALHANYLSHHLAGIVTAAVFADAAHIVEEIVLLKTRVTAAAAADPTE